MTTRKKMISIILITLFLSISSVWAEQSTNNVDEKVSAGWTPVQFSVLNNPRWLHAFPTNYNIYGMRLSMPWGGKEVNMYGIDFGGVAISKRLTGVAIGGLMAGAEKDATGVTIGGLAAGSGKNFTGIALGGLAAAVEGNFDGVAIAGFFSEDHGCSLRKLRGAQVSGLMNFISKEIYGTQIAGVGNIAEKLHGLQIGTINKAWSGGQIGLLNYNKSSIIPVCPILNFGILSETNLAKKLYATESWKWTPFDLNIGVDDSILGGRETQIRGLSLTPCTGDDKDIFGIGICGIYSECEKLYGMQMGIINGAGITRGLQTGIVNGALKVSGLQIGILNNSKKISYGLQCAGILNVSEKIYGCQIAPFNVADSGFQLGLLNFNENGFLPIFPLINFGWGDESEEEQAKEKPKPKSENTTQTKKKSTDKVVKSDSSKANK